MRIYVMSNKERKAKLKEAIQELEDTNASLSLLNEYRQQLSEVTQSLYSEKKRIEIQGFRCN